MLGLIYQQRAVASLATFMKSPRQVELEKAFDEIRPQVFADSKYNEIMASYKANLSPTDLADIQKNIWEKLPEAKAISEAQSKMAKALSLGYMSLTSSANMYNEAKQAGYDDRAAGFIFLLSLLLIKLLHHHLHCLS